MSFIPYRAVSSPGPGQVTYNDLALLGEYKPVVTQIIRLFFIRNRTRDLAAAVLGRHDERKHLSWACLLSRPLEYYTTFETTCMGDSGVRQECLRRSGLQRFVKARCVVK